MIGADVLACRTVTIEPSGGSAGFKEAGMEEKVARLVLNDVDYDQAGGGVPGAIPELQRQLPVAAMLKRRMTGPDRDDYFSAC